MPEKPRNGQGTTAPTSGACRLSPRTPLHRLGETSTPPQLPAVIRPASQAQIEDGDHPGRAWMPGRTGPTDAERSEAQ